MEIEEIQYNVNNPQYISKKIIKGTERTFAMTDGSINTVDLMAAYNWQKLLINR